MTPTVYHYSGCSTCKKALRWLAEQGHDARRTDLTADTPDAATLADLVRRADVPVRKFFNTSGNSYRNGGFKERLADMDEAACIAALAADGMLIKRPILDTGRDVRVGFREEAWAEVLAR